MGTKRSGDELRSSELSRFERRSCSSIMQIVLAAKWEHFCLQAGMALNAKEGDEREEMKGEKDE